MNKAELMIKYLLECKNENINQANEMLTSNDHIITLKNGNAYETLSDQLTDEQKEMVVQIVDERLDSFFQDLMTAFDNVTALADEVLLSIIDADTEQAIEMNDEGFLDLYFEINEQM